MEIKTKYHGVIEVEETNFIHFEHGIPGFLEEKEFILLPMDVDSPFFIMQSKQTSELGFVVTNPFHFVKDYEFDITDHDKETLQIKNESDIQIFTILSVKEPFSETTANLQAPIIINHTSKLAKQVILNDTSYTTKHKIIQKTAQR
ncbi:MAG: flagellar assembly protein FliW [Bacillota bacterium]